MPPYPRRVRFSLWTLVAVLTVPPVFSVYQEGQEYLTIPESAEPLKGLLPQKGVESTGGQGYLKVNSQHLKRRHNINFDTREVEIVTYFQLPSTDLDSTGGGTESQVLWQAYYDELNSYSMDMYDLALRRQWLNQFIGQQNITDGTQLGLFDIVLPVAVPDWLRRVGVDKPRLHINGSYKLVVAGTSLSGSGSPTEDGWFPNLHMDQQPAFSVKGSIGRLINIEINSEDGFGSNLKEQLKITYKGEGDELEDDIIQEIEAGHTSLSLTGTDLTGYTETHKGMFGLKMRMRFGGLDVTTLAAQESGSHERQKLGGGSEAREFQIEEKNMSLHKHFFMLLSDREAYRTGGGTEAYRREGRQRNPVEVYQLLEPTQEITFTDSSVAYVLGPDGEKLNNFAPIPGRWKQVPTGDFYYDEPLRMLTVNAGHRNASLAVRFKDDPLPSNAGLQRKELILIHSRSPGHQQFLDTLMWRGVYNVGKVNSDERNNFRVQVKDNEGRERLPGDSISYARRLGLEQRERPGVLDYDNREIFNFDQGYMVLPCLSSGLAGQNGDRENCLTPMRRISLVEDKNSPDIYNTSPDELHSLNSTRQFTVFGRQRQSTFNVRESSHAVSGSQCIDIQPGTEKLVLNGSTVLDKDRDYEVLYETGQITLTSLRARDPSADIEISYECTPLFQIQDKILLGTRLEYKLDRISDESMLGATLLYKSQTTSEERPDLGREPFNQVLWGLNARLTGNPRWMTDIANLFPFVQTEAPSRANFEFELAQTRYNANTKGEAYIDDFENSQSTISMPMHINSWFKASPPGNVPEDEFIFDENFDYKHKGEFIWHSNLREQYSRIYGNTGNSLTNSRELNLLMFIFRPNDNLVGNSWGGVMRAMSPGLTNQSRRRTLEVVVQGREGNLYVDMGEISEDVGIAGFEPNRSLDSEVPPGEYINKRDAGLDNRTKDDGEMGQRWECKPSCFSILVDSTNADPAGDNYDEDQREKGITHPNASINGTELNNQGAGGYQYDTEDLDRSGTLDLTNRYLRYEIPLDSACTRQFHCEILQRGWRKYQIPIYDAGTIIDNNNSATTREILSNVKMMRLWMGKLPSRVSQTELRLARVNIVGHTWEEGDRNRDFEIPGGLFASGNLQGNPIELPPVVSDSNRLQIEVVNTQEDSRYVPPPSWKKERDTRTDEPLPNRALVLKYENLHPGEIVHATRILGSDPKDLTRYSRILMAIHPDSITALNRSDPSSGNPAYRQHKVAVALQLGKDLGNRESRDYYEIRVNLDTTVTPGLTHRDLWDRNSFNVQLQDLTGLKTDPRYLEFRGRKVSRNIHHQGRGDSSVVLSVVGDPSLSRIDWMRLVLYVDSVGVVPLQTGQIWINDLRLEGLDNSLGTAVRTQLQLEFGDFINISGNMKYQDGGFTSMSQTRATPANSMSSADYNTNFSLFANKFFPDEWGLSLPLSAIFQGRVDRPFTKPSSDLGLTGTGFMSIVDDILDGSLRPDETDPESRLSRYYQSTNFQERYTASYKKERRSDNFLVQTFFERPEIVYSFAGTERETFFDASDSRNYKTRLTYNLSPYSNESLHPFKFSEGWKFTPGFVKNFTITPLPEKLNLTVGDLSYVRTHDLFKPIDDLDNPVNNTNYNIELTHGLDLEWRPLTFMNFGYRLSVNRDFDRDYQCFDDSFFNFEQEQSGDACQAGVFAYKYLFGWDEDIVDLGNGESGRRLGNRYFILDRERNRNQSFHLDMNSYTIPWFTPRAGFTSGYRHTFAEANRSLVDNSVTEPERFEANSDHEVKLSGSFSLPGLLGSLKDKMPVLEGARKKMDDWRLRNIDVNYTVSNRYNGEKFTYQFLDEKDLSPWDLYQYQLGWLYNFGNLATIFNGEPQPKSFGYQMQPADTNFQDDFNHRVERSIDIGSGFTLPIIDLSLSGNSRW